MKQLISNNRFFIALALLIPFMSCNKDALELGSSVNETEASLRTEGATSALYDYFNNNQRDFEIVPCTTTIMNPWLYDPIQSSVFTTDFFGATSELYNTYKDPYSYSTWTRNQTLLMSGNTPTVRTLIYEADSSFYETEGIDPHIFNFTGNVIEYGADEEEKTAYTFMWG